MACNSLSMPSSELYLNRAQGYTVNHMHVTRKIVEPSAVLPL